MSFVRRPYAKAYSIVIFSLIKERRILKHHNSRTFTVHLIKIGMLTLHQLSLLNRCVMTFLKVEYIRFRYVTRKLIKGLFLEMESYI